MLWIGNSMNIYNKNEELVLFYYFQFTRWYNEWCFQILSQNLNPEPLNLDFALRKLEHPHTSRVNIQDGGSESK